MSSQREAPGVLALWPYGSGMSLGRARLPTLAGAAVRLITKEQPWLAKLADVPAFRFWGPAPWMRARSCATRRRWLGESAQRLSLLAGFAYLPCSHGQVWSISAKTLSSPSVLITAVFQPWKSAVIHRSMSKILVHPNANGRRSQGAKICKRRDGSDVHEWPSVGDSSPVFSNFSSIPATLCYARVMGIKASSSVKQTERPPRPLRLPDRQHEYSAQGTAGGRSRSQLCRNI